MEKINKIYASVESAKEDLERAINNCIPDEYSEYIWY